RGPFTARVLVLQFELRRRFHGVGHLREFVRGDRTVPAQLEVAGARRAAGQRGRRRAKPGELFGALDDPGHVFGQQEPFGLCHFGGGFGFAYVVAVARVEAAERFSTERFVLPEQCAERRSVVRVRGRRRRVVAAVDAGRVFHVGQADATQRVAVGV